MIRQSLYQLRRLLARARNAWRRCARALAGLLPKGLYARSLLIVIVPMVLLQTAVAYVFMQRHFDIVTHHLSAALARDVGAVADQYRALPRGADDTGLRTMAAERFRMTVELMPPQPLPPRIQASFSDFLDPLIRALPSELGVQLREPFWVDPVGRSGLMEVRVDLGFGVLRLVTRRSLAYEPNVQIFIFWMVGASVVLIAVAILFLRNQIRPILRLAAAAEDFGKGRDSNFQPRGAREVRQAGYAFIEMKRRIERATEQRTAMLNGVSHDLRTILTRFRLSLEIMDETPEQVLLQADIDEMQAMLESYLAFARGDGGEPSLMTNLRTMIEELAASANRSGATVITDVTDDLTLRVRPLALKRCIGNLVANAQRYSTHVLVIGAREGRSVVINVDDNGPGISPEHRQEVFRPFLRLDESRNQDEGGSGLGLSIARDIARAHGGDIALGDAPSGGLRATIRIPV